MKLLEIYRTHPDIFVSLPVEQQQIYLQEAGFDVILTEPLTYFSININKEYQDVWSFAGPSALMAGRETKTIAYHNSSFTLYIGES